MIHYPATGEELSGCAKCFLSIHSSGRFIDRPERHPQWHLRQSIPLSDTRAGGALPTVARSCGLVDADFVDVQDGRLFDEQISAVSFEPKRGEPTAAGGD